MRRSPTSTSRPGPDRITRHSIRSPSTNGGCWPRPKSWRWPSAAFPACGPTASTTDGCRTTSSGSRETHNSFGRFYEVQSYGPDVTEKLQLPATTTSREWYRPNPPLPTVKWGPRNNTNIQESAILLALNKVAKEKDLYLENYWLKNKRSVQKGKDGPVYGWAIPAQQAASREHGRDGERPASSGRRGRGRRQGHHIRQPEGLGRRLHHPRRPAVPHSGGHVLQPAELSRRESAALRRHRLDDAVNAQRDSEESDGQVAPRSGL